MTKQSAPKRYLPTSPFKAPVSLPPKQFAVGDQVTHDVHGLGRVTGIEDGIAAVVDFGSTQERIVSPYAKMSKL
ncbi:CarD family transcriptional regulator [Streptomyces sp. NPDC085612]|uniref:CarD family transcriptional regulator n=1 Tax=Streptomyces sp. NPDC085612 TaxID=3365732 RepID=UPI0037D7F3E2